MKDIIEGLNLIKLRLVDLDKFEEAKIINGVVKMLENKDDEFNFSDNTGQINIGRGNSTINARQRNIINNSPVTMGDNNNQTINYGKNFPWEDD